MATHAFSVQGDGNSTQFVIESQDSAITADAGGTGTVTVPSDYVEPGKLLGMFGTQQCDASCMQVLFQKGANMVAGVPCFLLMENNQRGVLTKTRIPYCIGVVPADSNHPVNYVGNICEAVWESGEAQSFWMDKWYDSYPINTAGSEMASLAPIYNIFLAFVPFLCMQDGTMGAPAAQVLGPSGETPDGIYNTKGQVRLNFDQMYEEDPSNPGTFRAATSLLGFLDSSSVPVMLQMVPPGASNDYTFWDTITGADGTKSGMSYKALKWEMPEVDWSLFPEGTGNEGDKLKDQGWYREFAVEMISLFGFSISSCARTLSNGQRSVVVGGLPKDYKESAAAGGPNYPKMGDKCVCYQAFANTPSDVESIITQVMQANPADYAENKVQWCLTKGPANPQTDCFVADTPMNSAMAGPARKIPSLDPNTFKFEGFREFSQTIVKLCFWSSTGDVTKPLEFPWPWYSTFEHGSKNYPFICACPDPCERNSDGSVKRQDHGSDDRAYNRGLPVYKKVKDLLVAGNVFPENKRVPNDGWAGM